MSKQPNRFEQVDDVDRMRTIGVSAGEIGTGKSDFWLQGPSPIYVLSFDNGLEGVVKHVKERYEGKEIRQVKYDWLQKMVKEDEAGRQKLAADTLATFNEDYTYALKNARVVLVDKETDLWGVRIWAELGGGAQARYYGPLYDAAHAMVDLAIESDCTVGYIQSLKDEWVGEQSTGKRTVRGCNRLSEWTYVSIEHTRKDGRFFLHLDKCRQNPGLADMNFGPLSKDSLGVSFQEFGQMLIPDSSAEDWL